MENNYAMILINTKVDDEGTHYRRVLISYKGRPSAKKFGMKYFNNTRFIDCDDYFKNSNSSHQYKFEDDGYVLLDCKYNSMSLIGEKRQYHSYCSYPSFIDTPYSIDGIFKCKTDEEAKKIFNERNELR